jgi:hypothetical protein
MLDSPVKMSLALLGSSVLRTAIRRNLVSFPAQVPAFAKGDERQKRIAVLYFVRGWEVREICERYGLTKSTVRKSIRDWTIRAVAGGYIQEIHPAAAARLASDEKASKVAA